MTLMGRTHTLLMEITLSLLFLALSCAVLLQVFAGAHSAQRQSREQTRAMLLAQTTAEQLAAADDLPAYLESAMARTPEGVYAAQAGDFTIEVRLRSQPQTAGTLYAFDIAVRGGADAALSSARYVPQAEETP